MMFAISFLRWVMVFLTCLIISAPMALAATNAEIRDRCRDEKRELPQELREAYCMVLAFDEDESEGLLWAEGELGFARFLLRHEEYDLAIAHLKSAAAILKEIRHKGPLVYETLDYLVHALHLGGYQTHAELFEKLARLALKESALRNYLQGVRELKSGNAKEAEARFNEALGIDPENIDALLALEDLYAELDRYDESEVMAARAHTVAPNNSRAMASHGIGVISKGDDAEGIRLLRRAAELDRDNHLAHYGLVQMLGFVERVEHDLPAAIHHAREELRLDPDDPKGHYQLGIVLTLAGRFDEALAAHLELATQYYGYGYQYQRELVRKGFLAEELTGKEWNSASREALEACVRARCRPFYD